VTDPRDDLDAWLHREVDPLHPPPGTFERIRKQARRRKARRAVMAAASAGAAAAVIVVAVVALPRVVPSVLHLKTNSVGRSAAAPTERHSTVPSTPATSSSASAGHRRPAGPMSGPVPANFAATSVTFVSQGTGWVIGQAGIPGHCYYKNPTICTSVARTDDAGRSWYGLHAPVTGAPSGGTGVSQIRFLDGQNGWAFGPELWATHNAGNDWSKVPAGGLRVLSLETTGSEAFAVLGRCAGTGASYGTGCTQFFLWSSPAGSDGWAPVPGVPAAAPLASNASASSVLVLTGTRGYWYEPSGTLLSGPVTGGAPWRPVSGSALPCLPGQPGADGRPTAGQLAASAPGDLALACPNGQPGSSANQQETIYGSTDGGRSWQVSGTLTTAGPATSLAATTGGVLVLGTGRCIDVSADGGATWRQAQLGPAGGFSYVGMTSPLQGVAVPADSSQHAVWFTFDGGQSWTPSLVRGG
jgi:hypothetical protein